MHLNIAEKFMNIFYNKYVMKFTNWSALHKSMKWIGKNMVRISQIDKRRINAGLDENTCILAILQILNRRLNSWRNWLGNIIKVYKYCVWQKNCLNTLAYLIARLIWKEYHKTFQIVDYTMTNILNIHLTKIV